MVTTVGCDLCSKSSLSLLLLRPSPVAKSTLLSPAGGQKVSANATVISDLIPQVNQSRFALRLLRAGYVHVYIQNPPPGVRNWLVYRVTEQADLIPEGNALFSQPQSPFSCKRDDHIRTGTKLINIPQAHKISEIWLAYSATLWSDKIRDRNKADSTVMQKISLQNGSVNSFKPTKESLRAQVLECTLGKMVIDGSEEQDFIFTTLSDSVDELVNNMAKASSKHPRTAGKELAVVLRDPAAIAVELNSLRLRRDEIIKREFAKPLHRHPLQSSSTLLGLRKSVVDSAALKSYEEITPLISAAEYKRRQWPDGTYALNVTDKERIELLKGGEKTLTPLRHQQLIERTPMVRVIYPDLDRRAEKWVKQQTAENWKKYEKYYDEVERQDWLNNFNDKMKREHYDPLQLLELDWLTALKDERTVTYFNRHFDSKGKLGSVRQAVECLMYVKECASIHQPAPLTAGKVTEDYVALLEKNVNEKDAYLLRALVANASTLFGSLQTQLTGDPGKDGMRDKTFDLLKGFSELNMSQGAMQSYGWIGHALAFYSVGLTSAVSAAALSFATSQARNSATTASLIRKMHGLAIVQRALEIAIEGAIKGNAPKLPVLLTMTISATEALDILTARAGQNVGISRSQLNKHRREQNRVTLTLLTDTDAIKAAGGDLGAMAHGRDSGTVKMGPLAASAAVAETADGIAVLSKDAFLRLYQRQATLASKAANLLRDALPAMARNPNGQDILSLAKTLDARLALASMVIQSIGIWYGAESLRKADSSGAALDATYGLLDSIVGLTGGALQLSAIYAQTRLTRNLVSQAAARSVVLASDDIEAAISRSLGIGALRFLATFTGVAGGAINTFASIKKVNDQAGEGNSAAAFMYAASAVAFLGTAGTSLTLAVGEGAATLTARGMGGAVAQAVVRRFGMGLLTVGGVGLSISGIGLVLLGAGIAFQVGAVLMTPDELQRWMARSYFGRDGGLFFQGKRDDMFAKGDWKAEQRELDRIVAETLKRLNENAKESA